MVTPRKRSREVEAVPATTRVTRSSTARQSRYLNRSPALPVPTKKKKLTKQPPAADVAASSQAKTVVIEHCKQCNSFKTRAIQVKNGLENGVPGITVRVNPEKPRKGCFEIREEGGEQFISLLDMPRPFTPMKDLDMEKVIADIIEKIK